LCITTVEASNYDDRNRANRSHFENPSWEQVQILADALEDSGCTNQEILNHCRRPGEHARGCWCLDLILGKK
jgi:hypothetical protein